MESEPEAEDIIEKWDIDLEGIGKLDFGFSSIGDPYEVLYNVDGVGTVEYHAASAALAFLKYSEEADEGYERPEEIRTTVKKLESYRRTGIIQNDLGHLLDTEYYEKITRRLEDRNMNKTILEFEEDKDVESNDISQPKVKDNDRFQSLEKKLIDTLLGHNYNA